VEEDSLIVEENEDGTLSISWDKEDPKYSLMNDLTEEEITAMLMEYIRRVTDDESLLDSNE
jgi:hypothetical protein